MVLSYLQIRLCDRQSDGVGNRFDCEMGAASMTSLCHPTQMCWICGTAVNLENCKTDAHGSAVHERCYTAKLVLTARATTLDKTPPRPTSRLKKLDVASEK
jgi:hypothetical protein